jgi:hypothetical protein
VTLSVEVKFSSSNDEDHDGLTDADEGYEHRTDPLDADTDDDGLTDGDEVNQHGTDPLDADTDDDGLTDGDEVNQHGTDPLDADTDDDGLTDGYEVSVGVTDPLEADTDNDGLIDGHDIEFVKEVVDKVPARAWRAPGVRIAVDMELFFIERLLHRPFTAQARRQLTRLRTRFDGCGTVADSNDWIRRCGPQKDVREALSLLITNIS